MSEDLHYLVVGPAEDPDYPGWSEGFDWEVEHPEGCAVEEQVVEYVYGPPVETFGWRQIIDTKPTGETVEVIRCGIQWQIEQVGVEAFGDTEKVRLEAWPKPPFRAAIRDWHHTYPSGPHGPEEYDCGIELVEDRLE